MSLQEELKRFQGWYQTIDFGDGVVTRGCAWCGDPEWENVRSFLPESLEGLRILDIGCNAGIFCVRAALEGAEVVGVESDDWKPGEKYWDQAHFVKAHFEKEHGRKLNIEYLKGRMEELLWDPGLGFFDYVLAIASIYYSKTPRRTVEAMSRITNNVIARIRDRRRVERFNALFAEFGFMVAKSLQERWWEKLGRRTDDFYLIRYEKA